MHETQQMLHKTLPSFQIVNAGTHDAALGAHLPPHQHATWEFVYYRTGFPECPLGGETFACEPGMLLTTPPRTMHSEFAWTAYSTYWITIDAPATMPWPRMCMDNGDRAIWHTCTSIVREARGRASGSDHMLALLAEQLDLLLARAQEQHGLAPSERLVRVAEQVIEERFATPLLIKDVAHEVGVSRSYLRSQFVQLRGHTPMAYLQTIRVRRSIGLLRNSTLTLETIAGICGYDSASHLSRMVKRATGKSPGAVRKQGAA
jgi:AraC-like DNA-binding protein